MHLPIIAVINQKGGVGKTTLTTIIAEYGAIYAKKRILLVDVDMQCNLSDYFVGMELAPTEPGGQVPPYHPDAKDDPDYEPRSSILDTFYGKGVLPHETYIREENGFEGYVDIIVAHPNIEKMNNEFTTSDGRVQQHCLQRLKELLDTPATADLYDLVILDCAPSRQPIFRSAMRAATHVIIPYEPEEKAMQGINAMMHSLQTENFHRKHKKDHIKLVGIIANKVRIQTNLHKNNMAAVSRFFGKNAFPEGLFLPVSTKFPERDVKGVNPRSIFDVSKRETANIRSRLVSAYIFRQLFGIENKDTKELDKLLNGAEIDEIAVA